VQGLRRPVRSAARDRGASEGRQPDTLEGPCKRACTPRLPTAERSAAGHAMPGTSARPASAAPHLGSVSRRLGSDSGASPPRHAYPLARATHLAGGSADGAFRPPSRRERWPGLPLSRPGGPAGAIPRPRQAAPRASRFLEARAFVVGRQGLEPWTLGSRELAAVAAGPSPLAGKQPRFPGLMPFLVARLFGPKSGRNRRFEAEATSQRRHSSAHSTVDLASVARARDDRTG